VLLVLGTSASPKEKRELAEIIWDRKATNKESQKTREKRKKGRRKT